MGCGLALLLVDRRNLLAAIVAGLCLAGCGDRSKRGHARVDPREYRAFFLWPGSSPPDWLRTASEVYVLAGEVSHRPASRFVPLRAIPHVSGPRLWLTVRVERLDWQEAIYRDVFRTLALWERAGNGIEGLQIDFDAATRGLAGYAAFLADVRQRLPKRWKLSVTGLMDWSAGGQPEALRDVSRSIDEIVIQTYQGRRTIPGYEAYLDSLHRLGMPYRIGLVEGGEWRAPEGLERDTSFRGYVVFLLDR